MLIFIIVIPLFLTISTYYILQAQKPERKLLAKKIKRLRKQNRKLRKQSRDLKIQAQLPAYILNLDSEYKDEEIRLLKKKIQAQAREHLEFKDNMLNLFLELYNKKSSQ